MKLEILSTLQLDVPRNTTDADLEALEKRLSREGQVVNVLWKGDPLDCRITLFIYKRA